MPTPPKALEIPYLHRDPNGQERPDPYHWLQNAQDPAVLAHLTAENQYTAQYLSPSADLEKLLYSETLARIQETDQDIPWTYGPYQYYFRTQAGLSHEIFCRQPRDGGTETCLFDENVHAAQHDYFEVGEYALSLDQQTLLVTVDTAGQERYRLWSLDITTNTLTQDVLQDIAKVMVFSQDSRYFWYLKQDAAQRPYQVWCHDRTGQQTDRLIFEEPDERYWVGIYRSMSDAYLFVHVASKLTSEVHFTPADAPYGPLACIRPRKNEHEYDVDHHGDYFYIRTNEDAKNFSLKRCKITNPELSHWETVIPADPTVSLDSFSVFAQHIVLETRRDGLSQLGIWDTTTERLQWVPFAEPCYSVGLGENWEYRTDHIRIDYTSLKTPPCDYLLSLHTLEKVLLKQDPVLQGYQPEDYTTERQWATAPDGTLIPISLVYKTSLRQTSPAPALLTGYGAYGATMDPWFSYSRISLMERGFIFAIAHVRGGGEFGEAWHEAGRFLNKPNTFTDFIACAQHLVHSGQTSPQLLCIDGGSAGGLLIGAVINQAPDLFRAAIANVPFVDVLNTMLDDTLPLTVVEYEEWGNPHEPMYYQAIRDYAPYENIKPQAYPALFVTAGLQDPRVPYWEAAKWVAKLRQHHTGTTPILLKTHLQAGHHGQSGRYEALKEVTESQAFLLQCLGIT